MESKYQSIEEYLLSKDHSEIAQKRAPLWVGLAYILVGLVVIVLNAMAEYDSTSFVPHLLLVLSLAVVIFGLIKTFYRPAYFVANGKGKLSLKEVYFDVNDKERLVRYVETGNMAAIQHLKTTVNSGVKLKILAPKSEEICFVQVMQFVNFTYETMTEVKEFSAAESRFFCELK